MYVVHPVQVGRADGGGQVGPHPEADRHPPTTFRASAANRRSSSTESTVTSTPASTARKHRVGLRRPVERDPGSGYAAEQRDLEFARAKDVAADILRVEQRPQPGEGLAFSDGSRWVWPAQARARAALLRRALARSWRAETTCSGVPWRAVRSRTAASSTWRVSARTLARRRRRGRRSYAPFDCLSCTFVHIDRWLTPGETW